MNGAKAVRDGCKEVLATVREVFFGSQRRDDAVKEEIFVTLSGVEAK